jgi:hypothetical protein
MTSKTPGSAEWPELTTLIPADPRLPRLPQGEVRITGLPGDFRVDHADPRIVIGDQLLECFAEDPPEGVTLTMPEHPRPGCCKYTGAVLRIEAVNQTLIYRLTQCLEWYCGYIAEWPD